MIHSHSRTKGRTDRVGPGERRRNFPWLWCLVLAGMGGLGVLPISCLLLAPEKKASPAAQESDDPLALISRAHLSWDSGTVMVLTLNQRLAFIDRDSGRAVRPFHVPTARVCSAAISPDGQTVVVGYYDGSLAFENRGFAIGPTRIADAHHSTVIRVACSADGLCLASAGEDGTLNVWHRPSGPAPVQFPRLTSRITALAFSPDGLQLASGSVNGTIRLFDVERQREHLSIQTPHESVQGLEFALDGTRLYSAGADGTICCWNPQSGKPIWKTPLKEPQILAFAVSSDGKWMASSGWQKLLVLRNAQTGEVLHVIPWFGTIYDLQFSPSGQFLLLVTENQKTLHLYDLEQHRIAQTLTIEARSFIQESFEALIHFGLRLTEEKPVEEPEPHAHPSRTLAL